MLTRKNTLSFLHSCSSFSLDFCPLSLRQRATKFVNFYEILGVRWNASIADIKAAYKTLAKKYHPDINKDPSAKTRFADIQIAYEALSNPRNKSQYDAHANPNPFSRQEGAYYNPHSDFQKKNKYAYYDEDYKSESSQSARAQSRDSQYQNFFKFSGTRDTEKNSSLFKGADINSELLIDFMESYHGATKELEIVRDLQCMHCGGIGAEPGSHPRSCTSCAGQGFIISSFGTKIKCKVCYGRGSFIENPCNPCGGTGHVKRTVKESIRIPKGAENGQIIKKRGRGDSPKLKQGGGDNGDLVIQLRVRAHSLFQRIGDDVEIDLPLTLSQSLSGCELTIDTPVGKRTIPIRAGMQTNQAIVIPDLGFPKKNRGRGDFIARVKLKLETTQGEKYKGLVRQIFGLFKENN